MSLEEIAEEEAATIREIIQTPMPPAEKRAALIAANETFFQARADALGLSPEQVDALWDQFENLLSARQSAQTSTE